MCNQLSKTINLYNPNLFYIKPQSHYFAVKGMGAFQIAVGAELIWRIKCIDEDELLKTLQELNRLGFFFAGASAGWPASEVFSDLLEKRKLSDKFKEIMWRGPGDWFIVE